MNYRFLSVGSFFLFFSILAGLLATPLPAAGKAGATAAGRVERTAPRSLPSLVAITAHRAIGAATTEPLSTAAASDLTIRTYGLVAADARTGLVAQDSDSSSIYDDINDGTLIETVTVTPGALRLVAETSAVEPSDIDLYILRDLNDDGAFEQSEEQCQSLAPQNDREYCELVLPEAGEYTIVAHNREDEDTISDHVTLLTGVVSDQSAGNVTVTGPSSVAADTPYTLAVRWDIGDAPAGTHFYGAFDLGSAPGAEGDLGLVSLDLIRSYDEVTKLVSTPQAQVGDYVTYTITVSNYNALGNTYRLTDTLPAGLTLDPTSLTGGATYDAGSNSIRWSTELGGTDDAYAFTDSRSGGPSWPYQDLSAKVGVNEVCSVIATTGPSICDEGAAGVEIGQPFAARFYGVNYTNVKVWTNGFVEFRNGPIDNQALHYVAQAMPNAANPNGVFAALWTDLDLDGTAANDTGGGKAYYALMSDINPAEPTVTYLAINYKNVQQYGDASSDLNFNIFLRVDGVKSELCAVYGPTLNGDLTTFGDGVGVGLEDPSATQGLTYYYSKDPATASHVPAPGATICAVEQAQALPVTRTITFRAQVTGNAPITNSVTATSAGEYGLASSKATVTIDNRKRLYLPLISR